MRYQAEGAPLVVFAGAEYGNGSSRDWAAKGTALLGVRAVIAQSFERIHRSNLVGMGVLPLTFEAGTSWATLGLTGEETVTIRGLERGLCSAPDARGGDHVPGWQDHLDVRCCCASIRWTSWNISSNGGILPYVLRQLAS